MSRELELVGFQANELVSNKAEADPQKQIYFSNWTAQMVLRPTVVEFVSISLWMSPTSC